MDSLGWFISLGIPAFVLAVGLVVLLLSRTARSRSKSIPYAVLYGAGVTIWLTSLHYVGETFSAHRIAFAVAYALAFGALGLALTFPNKKVSNKVKALLSVDAFIGLAFIVPILLTDAIIKPDNFYGTRLEPFSLQGKMYLLLVELHLIASLAVFIYRYATEVRNRLYFNYIVLSFLVTVLIAGTTNLILPVVGVTSFALVGPLVAMLPFIAVVYALGITDIDDIRYVIARLAQVSVRLFLLAGFLAYGFLAHILLGLKYYSATWIASCAAAATVGVTVFYVFDSYLSGWIDRKVVYSNQGPEQIQRRLLSGLRGEIALGGNAALIMQVIKEAIGVRGVGIVLQTKEVGYWCSGDFELSHHDLAILLDKIDLMPGSGHAFLQRERLSTYGGVSNLIKQKSIYGIMPIRMKTDRGFYILGSKFSQDVFTRQDIAIVEMIAEIADLSIERALFYDRVQAFNRNLQERIEAATSKLRRTNQRLRELDETKDDFISMASHQLRTPLTSVKGYLSLVLEGDAGKLNETQAKMLRQAFSSSQRMVFLITDLLNISRLKTGKFVIETTPVDLSALVQEEVEQLHESAEIKQITLSFTKPATFPKLMLDETKVRQVIMNYIDNALYYTPVGGKVAVELTDKLATVELRVVDSGIGVPKAEQPHLFTKFYRATNARKARPDGTGLGLFMAKKAVTAQGGSIVFSSREGHGSTFGFVFSKTRLKVPENVSAVQHSLTAQIDADVAADKKRQKQPA